MSRGGGSFDRRARRVAAAIRQSFEGDARQIDVRCWSCGAVVGRIDRHPSGSLVAGDAVVELGPHEHLWKAPDQASIDRAFAAETPDGRRASLRSSKP